MQAVQRQLEQVDAERLAKNGEVESLRALLDQHREAVASQTATITALYAEIERLNSVNRDLATTVDLMRESWGWKLAAKLRRLKGQS